ncbi:MAG: NAD(P)-dependent oxidoreductase [Lachnospiraceae bacterium]|nr:NAD(P)-dependent oxidoreductase [Lachnospiraceae bacterium]
MKKIGFIGIGVMGKSMARNLMKAGFEVTVYSRRKVTAEELLAEGAGWADTPAACTEGQDAVITIVGFPKDVDQVYFGENGILSAARPGQYLIDMTTTNPSQAVQIYEAAKEKGCFAIDAPVSGGDSGARNAKLTIMCGGDREAFEACRDIFLAMGPSLHYMGGAGCGQHTKACNQIALAGCLTSAAEAISYARRNGLDPQAMYNAISKGAAASWQLDNNGVKMIAENYDPGFFIKHYVKDLNIAIEQAEKAGLTLELAVRVRDMMAELAEEGLGEAGTQSIIKHYMK